MCLNVNILKCLFQRLYILIKIGMWLFLYNKDFTLLQWLFLGIYLINLLKWKKKFLFFQLYILKNDQFSIIISILKNLILFFFYINQRAFNYRFRNSFKVLNDDKRRMKPLFCLPDYWNKVKIQLLSVATKKEKKFNKISVFVLSRKINLFFFFEVILINFSK